MVTPVQYQDFRVYLGDLYESRKTKNKSYSMRAFARDLDLSPSQLCEVLKGKYSLSNTTIGRISKALKFNIEERIYFQALVDSVSRTAPIRKKLAHDRILKQRNTGLLSPEEFSIVSKWYHYGIMELTLLEGFQNDPEWIALHLGITSDEAAQAIENLIELNLVKNENGRLVCVDEFTETPQDIIVEDLKKFHTEIINKAKVAIQEQSKEEREIRSIVMAVNSDQMEAMKEKIRKFSEEMMSEFGNSEVKDQVVAFSIQLFGLSKKTKPIKKFHDSKFN